MASAPPIPPPGEDQDQDQNQDQDLHQGEIPVAGSGLPHPINPATMPAAETASESTQGQPGLNWPAVRARLLASRAAGQAAAACGMSPGVTSQQQVVMCGTGPAAQPSAGTVATAEAGTTAAAAGTHTAGVAEAATPVGESPGSAGSALPGSQQAVLGPVGVGGGMWEDTGHTFPMAPNLAVVAPEVCLTPFTHGMSHIFSCFYAPTDHGCELHTIPYAYNLAS